MCVPDFEVHDHEELFHRKVHQAIKTLRLISNCGHCMRFWSLQTSDMAQTGFKTVQDLSLDFMERICVVATTTLSLYLK